MVYIVLKTIRNPETNLPIVTSGQTVTDTDIIELVAEYGIDEFYVCECMDSV